MSSILQGELTAETYERRRQEVCISEDDAMVRGVDHAMVRGEKWVREILMLMVRIKAKITAF